MAFEEIHGRFTATAQKGEVSSVLIRPRGARLLLVLGHGASTNYKHRTLQTIAQRCAEAGKPSRSRWPTKR